MSSSELPPGMGPQNFIGTVKSANKQAQVYPNGLTKRQWEFVSHVIDGENQSEAYRLSHNAENMNNNSIAVAASKLMKHHKVLLTLNQHLDEVGKHLHITTASLTARAMEAYEIAKSQRNPGQMVNAVGQMARLHGMNKDRKEVRIEDARVPKGKQAELMHEVLKLAQSLGLSIVSQPTEMIDITPEGTRSNDQG